MTTIHYLLAEQIAARLSARGLHLAAAESCTGGGLCYCLTQVPGSSAWFERGFVTYSNTAKIEMLGVQAATLARFGAVSEETAREMADGARQRSQAEISVAITGIAGPEGGSIEKPVGLVWIAFALPGRPTRSEAGLYAGNREAIRLQVIKHVLEQLLTLI